MNDKIAKKTQDTLGKVIKKPPLTEKLLNKPPFRFLHDLTTSVSCQLSGWSVWHHISTRVPYIIYRAKWRMECWWKALLGPSGGGGFFWGKLDLFLACLLSRPCACCIVGYHFTRFRTAHQGQLRIGASEHRWLPMTADDDQWWPMTTDDTRPYRHTQRNTTK